MVDYNLLWEITRDQNL